ncbi:MAG: hypothetical protein AB7D06_17285 [Pedobacter sp.]
MSLREIKRELAIDQANIMIGRVISVSQGIAMVRLADGRVVRAGGGNSYGAGDRVQLQTDGSSYTVSGRAPLAATDGEIIVHV